MQESIDDLYARWQKNPDVSRTVALCDALRGSRRADLVDIVGSHASKQLDVEALTAAARMYTDTGRLDDAQQVLIAAGRLAPRDGDVYRYLGEVLLRRGDAERAEKVLERAAQFGGTDAELWLDRARALLPKQQSSGMMAVAEELAQAAAEAGGKRPPRPPESAPDDVETEVRNSDEIKAGLGGSRPPPAAGRGALPAPMAPPPRAPAETSRDPSARFGVATAAGTFGVPTAAGTINEALDAAFGLAGADLDATQTSSVPLPQPRADAAAHISTGTPAFGSVGSAAVRGASDFGTGVAAPRRPGTAPFLQAPDELRVNPALLPARERPAGPGGQAMPEARDVLDALEVAGVFEPDGAVRPQVFVWDKPDKQKRRLGSVISLVLLAVSIVGGASGAYYYVTGKRARQHIEAEGMLAKVDADLRASDAKLLAPSEQALGRAFELESRSPHAALTWLHERAMVGLLKGGENVAFEDGTVRAKEVGIEEKRLAFGYVASFLFQGDTAGAAAALAKWDDKAGEDPWYQLVAGATFERAGDTRALERYAAAVRLDPELVMAQVLLARATAVDGDPRHAGELAVQFRAKFPDRLEGATLVALAWARDPSRGEPPPEAKEIADKADVLPTPLKAVAPAVRALLAIEQRKGEDAKTALQKGLAVADTPGVAAWLGSIALATGDEALARKGALVAVSFSAVYPPARMLAARVALLGARLDEAQKAAEELPPASADVAIVNAAVAYEKLDGERMRSALDSLSEDTKKLPFLMALVRGQALLGGSAASLGGDTALEMADDETPWADLVAMDAALDTGDLDLGHKIAAKWQGAPKPLRAVRLARLARWDGKNDDADRLSRAALEGGATVTVRAVAERVFVLVAMNKAGDATALFKAYPNVGGPLAKWLRCYALASHGKLEEARAIASAEDPPPPLAPLPARLIAAAAFGAVKDTRHGGDYVKALVTAGFVNPDLTAAAEKVGVGKIARKR